MDELTTRIWQGTQNGKLTGPFPEVDIDTGQQVQISILNRWLEQGEELAGYKIGLTSGTARDSFGPAIRPFGFILASRVRRSGSSVELATLGNAGLENELVFRVSDPIRTGHATAADARRTVDAVAPGFEINQIRLTEKASSGIRLAENLTQWGIGVGEFTHLEQDYEKLVVTLRNEDVVIQQTAAEGHIDNHFESIAALINRLDAFDRGLEAGQLLITGSFTRYAVDSPGRFTGEFGDMGSVTLEVL